VPIRALAIYDIFMAMSRIDKKYLNDTQNNVYQPCHKDGFQEIPSTGV
jgi:hypothetical protein